MSFQLKTNQARKGFTLVELVVVVSILAIVTVIVIPSVRILNEDRKIRDTARVVGAMFSAARERAAVDGRAGVEIVSIPSNPGAQFPDLLRYNSPNMGLLLYQLRAIPPYFGEINEHVGVVIARTDALAATTPDSFPTDGSATIEFRNAAGTPVDLGIEVGRGDFIELGNSNVQYEILNDPVVTQTVIVRLKYYQSPLPFNPGAPVALPFRIHRQPVRIQSSAVRLPNNLFLNMALSGHGSSVDALGMPPTNTDNQYWGRQFRDFFPMPAGHPMPVSYPGVEGSTRIWFGRDGSISQVTNRQYIINPGIGNPHDISSMEKPDGPVHLLMCNGNRDGSDLTNLDSSNFMLDDNSMWITINHRTGAVSMGKMAQFAPADNISIQIDDARTLARNRRSATP